MKKLACLVLCTAMAMGSIPASAEELLSSGDELFFAGETYADGGSVGEEVSAGLTGDAAAGDLAGLQGTEEPWDMTDTETEDISGATEEELFEEQLQDESALEDDSALVRDIYEEELSGELSGELLGDGESAELLTAGEADVLTSEAEEEEMDIAEAALSVNAGKDAWVAADGGFKLKKTSSQYYTAADGILRVTTSINGTGHTGYYMFDENGMMITGVYYVAAGTPGYPYKSGAYFYFTPVSKVVYYEGGSGTKTPLNSTLGQSYRGTWLFSGGRFSHFKADGRRESIKNVRSSDAFFQQNGYFKINGSYYAIQTDGTPYTGFVKIKGYMYYLDPKTSVPGRMTLGTWKNFNSEKGEKWLFFQPDSAGSARGRLVKHSGCYITKIRHRGTGVYLLDHNGYVQKNKLKKCEDGNTYGSNWNGEIYSNVLQKIGNYFYYFTPSGALSSYKNCWRKVPCANDNYYYFGNVAGRVSKKTGWQKVRDENNQFLGWFYFRSSGRQYKNEWMGDYHFDSIGRAESGLTMMYGRAYFFRVSTENTRRGELIRDEFFSYNGKWYYAEENGRLFKEGLKYINGRYYAFSDYAGSESGFAWNGSQYVFVAPDGRIHYRYYIVDDENNLVKFIDPVNGGFYTNCSVVIDGLRYYFDSEGYRINDLTDIYTGPYYVTVDRVNCVMTIYNRDRTVPVKSIRISPGADGTETPLGTYWLESCDRWQLLMGPSWGQFGVNVVGAGLGGIYIHSVPGSSPDYYSVPEVAYNILGYPASHGCIRCCVADVKWVYYNCDGAPITIFDGNYSSEEAMKGPLGRRPLVPMTGSYDPTDPAVVG